MIRLFYASIWELDIYSVMKFQGNQIKHTSNNLFKLGLGGGCHWCTEAVFASLSGVKSVKQGWISSTAPNESFSEAVLIEFNEAEISLKELIEIHLNTHSSTENHSMREKYRSAVYVMNTKDSQQVSDVLIDLQVNFELPLVTKVLTFKAFKINQQDYLDYYNKNPDKPFCQTYIKPKLEKVLEINPRVVDLGKNSQPTCSGDNVETQ